jgi:hypothetical protein
VVVVVLEFSFALVFLCFPLPLTSFSLVLVVVVLVAPDGSEFVSDRVDSVWVRVFLPSRWVVVFVCDVDWLVSWAQSVAMPTSEINASLFIGLSLELISVCGPQRSTAHLVRLQGCVSVSPKSAAVRINPGDHPSGSDVTSSLILQLGQAHLRSPSFHALR